MVVFRDSGRQSGEIARLRQREQMADAAVAHLSDLEARRLGTELISYARAYPDLDANVAFQMASNGIPAHSRLVADVAAESSELRAERSGPRGGRSFARQGEARRYGVAEFTDDGVFKGYSRFSEDENIQLVATIAQADPDTRADVYRSIRAGEFDPSRVVESISTANRPHRSLLNLFPKEDSETRVDQAHLRDKVYALAPTAAEALAARYRDGEFDNLGHLVVDGLNPALADQYGDDWRTAAFQISAEDQMVQEQINNALVEAELARVDGEGGGSWVGSLTRPLVAVFTAGGQFATNRFRQATGDLVEGIQGSVAREAFSGGSGGGFVQQPGVVTGPVPVSASGQDAIRAAAGATQMGLDVAALGMPGGVGAKGIALAVPELMETVASGGFSDDQRAAASATDLGVMLENPELAGDGLLIGAEAVLERQRRELDLAPTFANGEMVTFGRAIAAGAGLETDSTAFNVLSGAVDFYAALAGPGELAGEALIGAGRAARTVPGVRSAPIVGRFDPLFEAGGIRTGPEDLRTGLVVRPSAEAWVDSWRGRRVTQRLAEMGQVDDVMRAFNGRISVHAARGIADLDDASDIATFLKANMGIGSPVRATPRLSVGSGWRGNLRGVDTVPARFGAGANPLSRMTQRLTADLPVTDPVNVWDLDHVYRWASDYLANASVPREIARPLLEGLARTSRADRLTYVLDNISGLVMERTYDAVLRRRQAYVANRARAAWARGADFFDPLLGRSVSADEALDPAFQSRYAKLRAEQQEEARKIAESLTRHFRDRSDDVIKYNVDAVGRSADNPLHTVLPDGSLAPNSSPHLITETIHTQLDVPGIRQVRELRRVNKPLHNLMSFPGGAEVSAILRGSNVLLEFATTGLWKTAVLIRGAYILRVVGEEQFRIAANGGDALVNNPMAYFAWVTGKGGKNIDLTGKDLRESEEFLNVALGGRSATMNPLKAFEQARLDLGTSSRQYVDLEKGSENFASAWGGELSQLSSDPIARYVARNPVPYEAASSGVDDAFGVRVELTEQPFMTADELDAVIADLADEFEFIAKHSPDSRFGQAWRAGNRRDAALDYMASVERRIRVKTGGSVELREAVAEGVLRVDDSEIRLAGSVPSALDASDEFVAALDDFMDFAPDKVKGVTTNVDAERIDEARALGRSFLMVMGAAIIQFPTTRLSRNPVFRQLYWDFVSQNRHLLRSSEVPKLQKLLDSPSMRASVSEADAELLSGLGLRTDYPDWVAQGLFGGGSLTLKEFDLLAKGRAMDQTNDLLFNMVTRQQWADSARVIAPFAQAWAEVLTTWGKAAVRNPGISRRVQQINTVLSDEDLSDSIESLTGMDTIDGQGLVYVDDYGSKSLLIPWRGDVPMGIPLSSLSVGASFVPGLGPAVAIAVNKLLPNSFKRFDIPVLGEVGEILFPFGPPTEDVLDPLALASEFLPGYVRYMARAGGPGDYGTQGEVDSYNGRVIAAMQYLMGNDQTGNYDLTGGPEEWNRLLDDAKELVGGIGVSQFFSAWLDPAIARPQLWILDGSGNVQLNTDDPNTGSFVTALTQANLFRMQKDIAVSLGYGSEEAESIAFVRTMEITDSLGIAGSLTGKSKTLIPGGSPVTQAAYNWLQDNPDAPDVADQTWGFFAPQDEGEFYMPMYLEQVDIGDRVRLSPEQWVALSQDIIGDQLYQHSLDIVDQRFPEGGVPDSVRLALSDLRTELMSLLPGWNQRVVAYRGSVLGSLAELDRVTAEGGYFGDHELAPVVRSLLSERQRLVDYLQDEGISTSQQPFARSGATAPYRRAYNAYLLEMEQTHPEAAELIDRVFRAEIRDALEDDVASAGDEEES